MLRQNLAYKIIAILAAIFLWFYVMITLENPVVETGIGAVQVEPRGAAPGLSVEFIPDEVMVAVTGPRKAVSRLSADDVKAWVNLKDLGPGRRRVRPRARVKGRFAVRVKTTTVVAILRESSKKTLPVEIELVGLPAGYTPGRLFSTPPAVEVEGKEQAVSRVARVVAGVNVRGGEDFVGEVEPAAVGSDGRSITTVAMRPRKVWVEAALARAISARVVPVVVRTSGALAPGFKIVSVTVSPAVATITGRDLDKIHRVDTAFLPLRRSRADLRTTVRLIRPRLGSLVEPQTVDVSISIARR